MALSMVFFCNWSNYAVAVVYVETPPLHSQAMDDASAPRDNVKKLLKAAIE